MVPLMYKNEKNNPRSFKRQMNYVVCVTCLDTCDKITIRSNQLQSNMSFNN